MPNQIMPPIGDAPGKKEQVADMFNAIAPRYDLLNRVLSGGIDIWWRRRAINWLKKDQPKQMLDVATGTGDLAIAALRLNPEKVTGVDISAEMLRFGQEKIEAKGLTDRISLKLGDSIKLPFEDNQFDAITVGFGVRNYENLQEGLKEMRRVLRPGGALIVLEFSQPTMFPIKQFYNFYSKHVMPKIGRAVSGDSAAYEYLPESAKVFPAGEKFLDELKKAGYTNPESKSLTFGIASLYKGIA